MSRTLSRRGRSWGLLLLAISLPASPAFAGDPPPVCRAPWGEAPVRVACLGNSNTQSDWQIGREGGFPTEEGWCERLSTEFSTVNCGWGGATASPNTTGEPHFQGQGQLDHALTDPMVDIVVLAFGTNDIAFSLNDPNHLLLEDPTPAAIAEVVEALVASAEAAGASALVATSPHLFPAQGAADGGAFNDGIDELNAEILMRFPPEMIVDFTTGFGPNDFLADGLHVNSAGMAKRAEAAREGIVRLVPEPGEVLAFVAMACVALLRSRRSPRPD